MEKHSTLALLAGLAPSGCGVGDLMPFVDTYGYAAGSALTLQCGPQTMTIPVTDTTETIALGNMADLLETDSNNCAVRFTVSGSERIGARSALLLGESARFHCEEPSPAASLKVVLRGEARYLLVAAGEPLSLTLESARPVQTFAIFFSPALLAAALRVAASRAEQLPEDPFEPPPPRELGLPEGGPIDDRVGSLALALCDRLLARAS